MSEQKSLQKTIEFKISLDDNKYTYLRYKDGGQEALRHGEPWRQLSGDNLIYFMGCLIEEQVKQLEALQAELKQEKIWKEEDPRMLREQMRVHDVAFQHLHDKHKALKKENEDFEHKIITLSCKGTDATSFDSVAEMQVANLYKWRKEKEQDCDNLKLALESMTRERDGLLQASSELKNKL